MFVGFRVGFIVFCDFFCVAAFSVVVGVCVCVCVCVILEDLRFRVVL